MFDTAMTWVDLRLMLNGAGMSLLITFCAVLGGTMLGIVFGLVRAGGNPIASVLIGGVLDVFRSVPLLIQLILINSFNSIAKLGLSPFKIACITLGLYTAAYCTEIVPERRSRGASNHPSGGPVAGLDLVSGPHEYRASHRNAGDASDMDRTDPRRHERFGPSFSGSASPNF